MLTHFGGRVRRLVAKRCYSKIQALRRYGYSDDDIESICQYALVHVALNNDPRLNTSITTYLTATISGILSRELRQISKHHHVRSETDLSADPNYNDSKNFLENHAVDQSRAVHDIIHSAHFSQDIREVVMRAYEQISPSIRDVIDLYYGISGEQLTIEQIAKRLNIPVNRVKTLQSIGLRILSNVLKTHEFSEETRRIRANDF